MTKTRLLQLFLEVNESIDRLLLLDSKQALNVLVTLERQRLWLRRDLGNAEGTEVDMVEFLLQTLEQEGFGQGLARYLATARESSNDIERRVAQGIDHVFWHQLRIYMVHVKFGAPLGSQVQLQRLAQEIPDLFQVTECYETSTVDTRVTAVRMFPIIYRPTEGPPVVLNQGAIALYGSRPK